MEIPFFCSLKLNYCKKLFFLLHLFARDVLAMKMLEIEKTKPTFIISVLKVDILKVGLVFSISNFSLLKRLWQINGGVLAAEIWLYYSVYY